MGNEPLNDSPMGRAFFYSKTEHIMNCALGFKNPIDVQDLKNAFSSSIMLQHPRFSSLMVKDSKGVHSWEIVHVNIDYHIIVHYPNTAKTRLEDDEEVESEINAFLADISVSTPLCEDKPLWEVHVLMGLKCVVLRVHHALGDGVALMSMLNACFGENIRDNDDNNSICNSKQRNWRENNMWGLVKPLWLTLVFGLRLIGRFLWVKDKRSVISGGDGVELWPRKLVTVKFKLEEFKCVKKVIPSATMNDVLLGAVSFGLSKYLETKSRATPQGLLDLTGIVPVNLRKDGGHHQEVSNPIGTSPNFSSFGNVTAMVLLRIRCYGGGLHPLDHVKAMKAIMSTWFSPEVASWSAYRVVWNTTLVISNIMGPSKEIVIGDNPVTFIRMNISGLPHALTMHLVSYKGNADLQLMVAKDIIPDPEFLANCIQESLVKMKNCIIS